MRITEFLSKKMEGKEKSWLMIGAGFLIATLWIGAADLGMFPVETCIARYLICLSGAIAVDVIFSKRIFPPFTFFRQLIIIAAIGAVSVAAAICLLRTGIFNTGAKHVMAFVFGTIILACLFISYIRKSISRNLFFACIVFVMGTVYTLSYPVGTGISWDDQDHYINTLQISHFNETDLAQADRILVAGSNPKGDNTLELLHEGKPGKIAKRVNESYAKKEKPKKKFEKRNMRIGVITSYLPEATTIFLCRGTGIPYSYVFVLGRWIGVLFFSVIFYFSLTFLQSGKLIFFMVAMLPITIFLMSNYSYDTWALGLSMLAFAYYIGIMQDARRKMALKDILLICGLFILAYSAKPNYFIMVLAILFIDNSKLAEDLSKKKFIAVILFTCAILASSFVIPYLVSGSGGNDIRGGAAVDSAKQIQFILGNPLRYTQILLGFLKEYFSPALLSANVGFLGFLGFTKHTTPYMLIVLAIVLLDKSREEIAITNAKNRIWTFLLAFATSCLFATIMYIAFTPVGKNTINGCQGRYLLPLLPFLFYYIGDFRIVARLRDYITEESLVITASVTSVIYALYCIYSMVLCYY